MDVLSRRYGQLPSDIKNLSVSDYQFNQIIASVALTEENKSAKKNAPKKGRYKYRNA